MGFGNQQNREAELDRLFQAYREACTPPEPGVNFMPAVWQQIEARRGFTITFRKWAQAFALAGAAACIMLGALMISPLGRDRLDPHTYVEVLDAEQSPDRLVFEDIALREPAPKAIPAHWAPNKWTQ